MNESGSVIADEENLLISYLQYLLKEKQNIDPKYTDADFKDFLHNKADKIKVPLKFRPNDIKW